MPTCLASSRVQGCEEDKAIGRAAAGVADGMPPGDKLTRRFDRSPPMRQATQERRRKENGQGEKPFSPLAVCRRCRLIVQLALRRVVALGGNLNLHCADNVARIELSAAM